MNNVKLYHIIAGIISWLVVARLLNIRIPFVSKTVNPIIDKLTSSKSKAILFGILASGFLGNWYVGGQPSADPIGRLVDRIKQILGTLTLGIWRI